MSAVDILRSERDKLQSRRTVAAQELTRVAGDVAQVQQKIDQLTTEIINIRDALATLGST